MSWEELEMQRGVRRDINKWSIVGWMMIRSAEVGGRVVAEVKSSKAKYLQFTTLPFLPKGVKFAERPLEIATSGNDMTSVKVRLPWISKEGRPIPQQTWDAAA